MYQGTVNALLIAAAGILFAVAAWQRPRLERAVYAVAGQTLRAADWVAGIVKRRREGARDDSVRLPSPAPDQS
jgi:hypothetical protein